jgi:Cu/Ag efflux protein CusF
MIASFGPKARGYRATLFLEATHMTRTRSRDLLAGLLIALIAVLAIQAQQPAAKKGFPFRGKVEKVDVASNSVMVANDPVPGWMPAPMTHAYRLDDGAILKQLKPGTFIVATVYEDDFATLYGVRIDATRTASDLPPFYYACRTPGEELDVSDTPGKCLKSGEPLVPVRITTAYTCLTHPDQNNSKDQPGVCPLDRKELVPIIAELYFVCAGRDPTRHLDPGSCPDGTPRRKLFVPRPHGDHNPRHGGRVYMSENQRDHIEGTFVAPGTFRVYFYDALTQPIPPAGVVARIALTDSNARVVGSLIPLTHAPNSPMNTLEARVPGVKMPFDIQMLVRFREGEREQPFDFTFTEYSKEP